MLITLADGTVKEYDEVNQCSNGFLNVKRHNRYGYINSDKKLITPMKYEAPADYKDGFAFVKYDRGYFKIDEEGNEYVV